MASSNILLQYNLIISFILLLSSLPSSLSSASSSKPATRFSKIYAFGDSFTDTGNTHSATGPSNFGYVSSPPYGTTFFHRPTNRYSDGRLVVDFLASTLSLPFLLPYLRNKTSDFTHGVNFAVAGATAIEHSFFRNNNLSLDITPQSIGTQLGWFDKYLEDRGCGHEKSGGEAGSSEVCNKELDGALFWVGEIGANDYAYSVGSRFAPQEIRDLAVGNVHSFLQGLLERGAKYIIVQGLPLTGCLPLSTYLTLPSDRDQFGCSASVNNQSQRHNLLLQSKLQLLRKQYPKSVISYADYSQAHLAILKNPAKYGFTETLKTCCGSGGGPYNFNVFETCGSSRAAKACPNPAKYVNWDGVHLTEATYKVVADMFFKQEGYCHPSFQSLLSMH